MSFSGLILDNKLDSGETESSKIIAEADITYSNGTNHNNNIIRRISSNINTNRIIMPSGAISQPRLATPTLVKSMYNSSSLSLALVRYY